MHNEIKKKTSMNLLPSPSSSNLLAPRPLRRCRSASPCFPKTPLLTTEQQGLIKKSWMRMPKATIGRSIYHSMTEKCPETKNLFIDDTGSIDRHSKYFVDLIQSAMDNITDMETGLRPWLEMLGKGHAGFAIKTKHWDAFGEGLLTAISQWVGPGKSHRETIRAWTVLSSFIADQLGSASRGSPISSTPRIQLLTLVSDGPLTPT